MAAEEVQGVAVATGLTLVVDAPTTVDAPLWDGFRAPEVWFKELQSVCNEFIKTGRKAKVIVGRKSSGELERVEGNLKRFDAEKDRDAIVTESKIYGLGGDVPRLFRLFDEGTISRSNMEYFKARQAEKADGKRLTFPGLRGMCIGAMDDLDAFYLEQRREITARTGGKEKPEKKGAPAEEDVL